MSIAGLVIYVRATISFHAVTASVPLTHRRSHSFRSTASRFIHSPSILARCSARSPTGPSCSKPEAASDTSSHGKSTSSTVREDSGSISQAKLPGPIVRIGPNTLSINTIGALEEIYASRKANVQKADWYRTIDAGSGAFSTHSEIDRSKHAFRRRVLAHAFSDAAVRSAETLILENVNIWCKYLGEPAKTNEWTPSKNMGEWANYLSYDIMGNLTFGARFECIEKNEHRYVPGLMMRATEYVYVVSCSILSMDAS